MSEAATTNVDAVRIMLHRWLDATTVARLIRERGTTQPVGVVSEVDDDSLETHDPAVQALAAVLARRPPKEVSTIIRRALGNDPARMKQVLHNSRVLPPHAIEQTPLDTCWDEAFDAHISSCHGCGHRRRR